MRTRRAAELARGLALTTTAEPAAVEMDLRPGSEDSGSSRLTGAAAAAARLPALSISSRALSSGAKPGKRGVWMTATAWLLLIVGAGVWLRVLARSVSAALA